MLDRTVSALCIVVFLSLTMPATAQTPGRFRGEAVFAMLSDGRNIKLLKPFGYVDPKNRVWDVPAGIATDGASIPRVLWVTHPPFTGKYRLASVIHDYYCQTQSRPWRDTHRVFYDAMLTGGVDDQTAKVMYGAVYSFGPRWGHGADRRGPTANNYPTPEKQAEFMREYEAWVSRSSPSLEVIQQALDAGRIPN